GILVNASLSLSNYTAGGGATLTAYILPPSVSGSVGKIDPKSLTASLTGVTSKTYDGATNATLSNWNYVLTGLISGESFLVTQTSATYA
ncbi:YDG domain-containing protein, partial [Escherichia coli]|uniref:YDG domain-containing protein n=1 Tax=Escherichia coli TaxID=562 RepID=UPI003CE4FEA7